MRGQGFGAGIEPERKTCGLGSAPDRNRGVSVFADDGCVDGARVDVQLLPKDVAQTLGVEQRAGADDAIDRKA